MEAPATHRSVYFLGQTYTFLATWESTNGAYALIHAQVPRGDAPPVHIHHRECESFYVLEGNITFQTGDERKQLGAGEFIHIPKGTAHTFWNDAEAPARMLLQLVPAGLDGLFLRAGTPTEDPDRPPPPFAGDEIVKTLQLAPEYGLEIITPDSEETGSTM